MQRRDPLYSSTVSSLSLQNKEHAKITEKFRWSDNHDRRIFWYRESKSSWNDIDFFHL